MKVTVCFGNVRVVVPCGDGDILVRDLIREAILRYKKATGKGPSSWVSVHNLQSAGGGILDPDDRLSDVADDREQILASFEDAGGGGGGGGEVDGRVHQLPLHHHGGGDGASGSSSVGTGSPDIFTDGDHKYTPAYSRTDIEVTGEQIASGVPTLQVRRGSEPTLNQPQQVGGAPAPPHDTRTKRWSAAPLILEPPVGGDRSTPEWLDDSREEEEGGGFRRVARDGSSRLSMQFLGDGAGYRWAEAADRAASARQHHSHHHTSTSLPREARRKEPLGQANTAPAPLLTPPTVMVAPPTDRSDLIVIRNQPGPLGIHVVPDYDGSGKDRGLLVQGIEPGGRIDRDGRLAIYDRIVEINGQNLVNVPFQRVQEMFKISLTAPELRLRVIKNLGLEGLRKPPPPVYPHSQEDKENAMVECEQKHYITDSTNTKVATVSPTKKVPAISKNLKGLLTTNTRKIGRKIEIELIKGPRGLGFSITTRDNPAGGNCPIYIKNIIPEGAAVEDGRLKIGDRLLQVNDEEMTGKSQAEAVAVLRKVPPGSKVKIVVSRQEDVPDTGLPRIIGVDQIEEKEHENQNDAPPVIPPLPQSHLQALQNRTPEKNNSSVAKIISQFQEQSNFNNPPEKLDTSMVFPWKHREILTYNIPVHDSEKAGLGISVKGKTSESGDLGIFIKSVINGGAASRDKRLRTNDQLLNVNGISLLQQSNSDAMETLRKAMLHTEGPVPGSITLTIARRGSSPSASRSNHNRSNESLLNSSNQTEVFDVKSNSQETTQDSVDNSNSNASGGSTNTVIYNHQPHQNHNGLSPNQMSPMHTWNPVLERLTGNAKPHPSQLRNESYYRATHDTWTGSMLGSPLGNMSTVNMTTAEPILIEDEYGSRVLQHQNPQINVHMPNKPNISNGNIPENRNDHEPDGKANNMSNLDKNTETSSQSTIQNTDATYSSQLSLENPQGFSRDAFGRQSMSEKRHATLDAKSTDTYQRTKKMREERTKDKDTNLVRVGSVESVISVNRSSADHPESADKLGQLGPSLGMKKSSSLESLQTMVQEIQMKEEGDPAYSYRGPSGALKVIRGRGCEESFRAAVVDPNHRSEIGAKKHWLLDGPVEEREIDGFNNVRGAPRQSSLNAALDNKNKAVKKKPGFLKGIGSMFRFGKHRKMDIVDPPQLYHHNNEFDANANVQKCQENDSQSHQSHHTDNQSQSSQSERLQQGQEHQQPHNQQNHHQRQNTPQQMRESQQPTHREQIHREQQMQREQQIQREQQMQKEQQIQREPLYQRHGFVHRHAEQVQVIPENSVAPPVKYRQNSSEQRKNDREVQRQRIAQRHTYYQQDERENIYDHRQPAQRVDPRDTYGEYGGRPGSRSGITESVPFTHYVNYNELQTHISGGRTKDALLSDSQIVQMRLQVQQQRLKVEEESRKQHQYHSQRQTRPDSQLRPISNYYEYESVQSVLTRGRQNIPIHMTQSPQTPGMTYQDVNSNSLPRSQQPQVQGRHPHRGGHPHRGPFVTQVTIGDHQKNGTKV